MLKELTEQTNLELSDICVMAVFTTWAQYEAEQTTPEMSYNDIQAEFPRLSLSTIKRSITRLAANGYIEIVHQPKPKKNRYKVLIDIPKVQSKTQPIQFEKNSNKIASSDDYAAEAKRVMTKNPFLQ